MTFPNNIALNTETLTLSSSSTSSSVKYDLSSSSNTSIEFVPVSNGYEFYVNSNATSGDPILFKTGASGSAVQRTDGYVINQNTIVWLYRNNPSNDYMGNFTVGNWTYSSGPTVTPATYDVPNDTGGRTSLQNLFRIYDLKLIKFGNKGYQVSFQHEDAPSTFNVYVCYTNTNNDTVEDQYSVNISTANSNKTVYLKKVQTYLPKAGTIDIKFQTQATLAGNPNQTFLANTTMKSFTYVPNDLTVTFSPNVGTPGTTVTLSITGSDNTYVSTQEAYLIPPNWFEANVGTTTITKNNLGQFDYTNTFNVIEGTYNVTHPQGAQYNIANATYDANYVAPSTTSNGGGKPDRYPLIMTNLFNRNRSIYSIGMTHKDTWDLFL